MNSDGDSDVCPAVLQVRHAQAELAPGVPRVGARLRGAGLPLALRRRRARAATRAEKIKLNKTVVPLTDFGHGGQSSGIFSSARCGTPKQSWRLVFRASAHGFAAPAFHSHCDGVAPVLLLVQVRPRAPRTTTVLLHYCTARSQASR
ncbi:jg23009 [Pararge aegeria aegeria]|uniref:Jg23009 protein n=1 Tax=Pararge aegeria aegeria TaxID=348720 RepID=A0A8S4QN04_9NEOP|nr:jg23009 [Pararge aegeria aegeria]